MECVAGHNLEGMFRDAAAFNQDIGQWNVSQVTDMGYMFYDARAFNRPLANWVMRKGTNNINMIVGTIQRYS